MRLIWIAPEVKSLPPLAWLAELGEVQNISGVEVTACTGPNLTRADVARVLASPADVVLFSGHGEAGCLALSDKVFIKPQWIALQVKRANPRLVILAACSSLLRDEDLKSMAELCCRQGLNTIGMPSGAADSEVVRFNVELIRALSANCEISEAFDVAMEEVAEGELAKGVFLLPGLRDTYPNFNERLDLLEREIGGLRLDVGAIKTALVDGGQMQAAQGSARPQGVGTGLAPIGPPRVNRGKANGRIIGLRAG